MQNTPTEFKAFTTANKSIVLSLKNNITIAYNGKQILALALWDTGATSTCISYRVVKELSLKPSGTMLIRTPSGHKEVNNYYIDMVLPNQLLVQNVIFATLILESRV